MTTTRVQIILLSILLFMATTPLISQPVKVGSKPFNESYILAEIMAQLLETHDVEVERKFGLGGTLICYEALLNHEIDIYPEYSGTINQAILKLDKSLDFSSLQDLLKEKHGLRLLESFGFNNTYALAVRPQWAQKHGLKNISDLAKLKKVKYGFSYEYIKRGDGWPALSETYQLNAAPVGMEHTLCYPALAANELDVMDAYSTDAELEKFGLLLLRDDKSFFPTYFAAPFIHDQVGRSVKQILRLLEGKIDENEMQRLNAFVAIEGKTFAEAADMFLKEKGLKSEDAMAIEDSEWSTLLTRTWMHLQITGISLIIATLLAVPLGILAYRTPGIAGSVIYIAGLMQTIPSLALLAFMIAPFGVGMTPALIALTLYALLPILRNTCAALNGIDPLLKKVAIGMGLNETQRLLYIELPLAMPIILAGIRTAAVITIGTATLAAFIGAGGLGEYIQTGLALNDVEVILWGAIPAALLAILTEFLFESLEQAVIPKHLLQKLGK